MVILRIKKYFFILSILIPSTSLGQLGGNTVYRFLSIGYSAKIEALGGKMTAYELPGIDMITENPALGAKHSPLNSSINYSNSFSKINYGSSFIRLDSFWTVGLQFIQYGEFIRADEKAFRYENFSVSEYAFVLNYSKYISKNISVGFNAKPILSDFYLSKSIGIASDWGIFYHLPQKLLHIGFVIKNLGFQIKPYFENNHEALPLEINMSVSKNLEHAPFSIYYTFHNIQKPNLRYQLTEESLFSYNTPQLSKIEQFGDNLLRHSIFSVKLFPEKKLNILFGYNYQKRSEMSLVSKKSLSGFSFGMSLHKRNMEINYAYSSFHLTNGQHQISILLNTKASYFRKIKSTKQTI